MNFNLMHPADQIVMIMDRIYSYKMTTTSGGNLSIKDSDNNIWISPSGIDKGSLTRDDIVCVKPDGTVTGKYKPSIELPFHQMLYKKRPDIRAVLHAHPPALVSCSLVGKVPDTTLYAKAHRICGKVLMSKYEIPGSEILAKNITDMIDDETTAVMMENHGVVVIRENLFSAFKAFETLEYSARVEINAMRIGKPHELNDDRLKLASLYSKANLETFKSEEASSFEREMRFKMIQLIHRCYEQGLFTSTQGTFSRRLGKDDFLITPYDADRKYMDVSDIVRIKGGKCEEGKVPSNIVGLYRCIYDMHAEINSIIFANPPSITAFAVCDAVFDSRTIPESYINLRTSPKYPFGSTFTEPEKLAKKLTLNEPVGIIENDGVITVGDSLISAFDRLEVAEASAKSIIDATLMGQIHLISDNQVADIDKAFNLKYDN